MDPFSRKLFKKSDARERLSQMGGIVASSPELASTVQRFQVGGDVTGLPPELLNNPSVQRLAARQGLSPAEYLMSLSPEALAATMAQLEQQAARPDPMTAGQNLMEMVPSFDPAPMGGFEMDFGDAGAGFPMPPPTPAEEIRGDVTGLPHTGPGMGVRHASGQSGPIQLPPPTPAEEIRGDVTGLPHTGPGMGVRHASGQSGPIQLPPATPAEVIGLDTGPAPMLSADDFARSQRTQGMFPSVDLPMEEDLAAQGVGAQIREENRLQRAQSLPKRIRQNAETALLIGDRTTAEELMAEADQISPVPAEDELREQPEPERTVDPMAAEAEAAEAEAAEQEAAAQAAAAEAPERTVDPMAGAADETANELRQVFGVPSPDRAPKNRRERVEQELDLIKEVFGHRNKDEARERAMNLAMIGLAIAAGQSPNALTNIAQGALAGTQAMQRAQGAAREREDALRMQAYESVLGEEREERQLGRQVQLEQIKARLRGSEAQSPFNLGTATGPLNRFFARVEQLETEFGNVDNPLWEDVRDMPYAERSRVAREIALSETMPAFEGAVDPQIQAELQQLQRMATQSSAGEVNPVIQTRIQEQRARGLSDSEITRLLRDAGHNPELYGIRP